MPARNNAPTAQQQLAEQLKVLQSTSKGIDSFIATTAGRIGGPKAVPAAKRQCAVALLWNITYGFGILFCRDPDFHGRFLSVKRKGQKDK